MRRGNQSTVEVSDWIRAWLHEPLDLSPALARRKSIHGLSFVPPRHLPFSARASSKECFPSYGTSMRDSDVKNWWGFGASE